MLISSVRRKTGFLDALHDVLFSFIVSHAAQKETGYTHMHVYMERYVCRVDESVRIYPYIYPPR